MTSVELTRDNHSSSTHRDVPNKAGVTNWVERAGGLPDYIRRIAKHLMADAGMSTSQAIATAVNTVKRWARGGGNVTAATQAKAAKALAEWNAKKGLSLRDRVALELAWRYDPNQPRWPKGSGDKSGQWRDVLGMADPSNPAKFPDPALMTSAGRAAHREALERANAQLTSGNNLEERVLARKRNQPSLRAIEAQRERVIVADEADLRQRRREQSAARIERALKAGTVRWNDRSPSGPRMRGGSTAGALDADKTSTNGLASTAGIKGDRDGNITHKGDGRPIGKVTKTFNGWVAEHPTEGVQPPERTKKAALARLVMAQNRATGNEQYNREIADDEGVTYQSSSAKSAPAESTTSSAADDLNGGSIRSAGGSKWKGTNATGISSFFDSEEEARKYARGEKAEHAAPVQMLPDAGKTRSTGPRKMRSDRAESKRAMVGKLDEGVDARRRAAQEEADRRDPVGALKRQRDLLAVRELEDKLERGEGDTRELMRQLAEAVEREVEADRGPEIKKLPEPEPLNTPTTDSAPVVTAPQREAAQAATASEAMKAKTASSAYVSEGTVSPKQIAKMELAISRTQTAMENAESGGRRAIAQRMRDRLEAQREQLEDMRRRAQ